MVDQPGAYDMSAIHHGEVAWGLEPRLMPSLPPPWDIASQLREALRYSLAGAYQGALLTAGALILAALGVPLRGPLLLPILLGIPLWIVSEAYLLPRRRRALLVDYASRFPGLWEWSRYAVVREDRRAARGALALHGIAFALLLPSAWALWPTEAVRVFLLSAAATGAGLTLLQLIVLASGLNSAGVRLRSEALARAARG